MALDQDLARDQLVGGARAPHVPSGLYIQSLVTLSAIKLMTELT